MEHDRRSQVSDEASAKDTPLMSNPHPSEWACAATDCEKEGTHLFLHRDDKSSLLVCRHHYIHHRRQQDPDWVEPDGFGSATSKGHTECQNSCSPPRSSHHGGLRLHLHRRVRDVRTADVSGDHHDVLLVGLGPGGHRHLHRAGCRGRNPVDVGQRQGASGMSNEHDLLNSIDPQAEAIEEVLAAEGRNCLTKDCPNAPTVSIESDAGTFRCCPECKPKYMPKPKRKKKESK